MKREFFAVEFYATETLRNGNERETTQTVYFPARNENGTYTDWVPMTATERAEEELKKQHYYKLIFKKCSVVKLNVVIN